jgi:ribonuclease P protein component
MADAKPDIETPAITRLRRRAEFLACARAPSLARGAVVVQALAREDGDPTIRVGFTATKRIGGAVVRNRAKRRLRAAARRVLTDVGAPGFDYVLIARGGAPDRPWVRLLDDVKSALIRLAADRAAALSDPRPASPHSTESQRPRP